ncbi:MAG: hypothetical protein L0H55_15070 [Candidatus Nitrosocosmicus sp.]|nr:hypothetical protein [Candidatus Nitrosocosmicus sp.]
MTITYVLLLNAPHLTWALAIAITSGITIFLLNLRRPDLLFPNEEEYLLNYEIIKNVIIVSTILLLITTIFSSNIFDITNPYLDHPLGILLLQLIQFTVTIILFIEIIVLLIIFRDREYALRLSIGHIKSIFNNEELSDDNISKSIISSLNFYNKYLQRTFGVTIVPIERLYEYVLFSSIINKAVLLSIFESQFRIGKLELLKYLRLFLAGEENNQRSQFLSGKNKMKPFIELSAIIIPILAVLVSVIDLLFK